MACVFRILVTIFLAGSSAVTANADTASDIELFQQVQQMFKNSCYGCHGQPGFQPTAGLDVLDTDYLLSSKLLIPGDSEGSKLYTYVKTGYMPFVGGTFPNGDIPPDPNQAQIAALKKWIDGGAKTGEVQTPLDVIAYGEILTAISKDITSVSDIKQVRYVSFAHLKNEGLEDTDLTLAGRALAKFFNSVSMNKSIVLPQPIDSAKLIYRVELRSYKLLPKSWDRFEEVYPFGVKVPSETEKQIAKKIGTDNAFLRGDWLIESGVRPPLYHDVLFADQMGIFSAKNAVGALEKALGVDRIENILNSDILRAGFNSSGVSVNNRIIERHEINTHEGAYWLSYDFLGNSDDPALRQSIFTFPLGPAEAFPGFDNTFLYAGGEVIFNLPNGLQGYLLANSTGDRLDKAPHEIVTDPLRPDHAVENAISCFRCHAQGMIFKQDTLHGYIENNKSFFASDLNVLFDLYKGNSPFAAAQQLDRDRFLAASKPMKIDFNEIEPVTWIAQTFEEDVGRKRLAAEFYLSPEALDKKVAASKQLQKLLGPLYSSNSEKVKRSFVIDNYQDILNLLNP